jgi:hypothetical protein
LSFKINKNWESPRANIRLFLKEGDSKEPPDVFSKNST